MDCERYTVSLLLLRPDAPVLDEQAEDALQDAHMGHLADLHEAGYLLAGLISFQPGRLRRSMAEATGG